MQRAINIWILLLGLLSPLGGYAAENISDRIEEVRRETSREAGQRIQALLERFCAQQCQLLDIRTEVHETIADSDDLGFEGTNGAVEARSRLEIQSIRAGIQIDSRVLELDRQRLEALIRNKIRSMAAETQIVWDSVELPSIGLAGAPTDELEQGLESRLRQAFQSVIDRYCPDQCMVDRIEIDADEATASQLRVLPSYQVFRGRRGEGGLRIREVRVLLTMDEAMTERERDRIVRLLQAQSRFVQPVIIQENITEFPETAADKRRKAAEESADPYGLEKLRQMLILFRDLASTKEVIQTQTLESKSELSNQSRVESNSSSNQERFAESKEMATKESNASSSTSSSSSSEEKLRENSRSSDVSSSSGVFGLSVEELAVYGAGLVLLLTLVAIVLLKFSQANRAAREMIIASRGSYGAPAAGDYGEGVPMAPRAAALPAAGMEMGSVGMGQGGAPAPLLMGESSQKQTMLTLKVAQLKQDLIQQFIEQRAVARETFSRLLKDEGVGETAKYVAIFGQLIVSELLSDPTLKRDLYELSEYFHRANLKFDAATELTLLERLKTMVTASEIRLLANQSTERFGFLNRLDGQQIYNLIIDENPRLQSIVLTQLDRKKRSLLFELFSGDAKIKLLEELSHAEAIPREFLFNVAQALQKKMQSRSEFDTENLRSSDILLDLLERANLKEQKRLMRTLERNNPETARALKVKFVTVEMLRFLKDGHLLEVVLGMDREDLLAFLVGADEHIRDLLLRKAPDELAASWIEDIRNLSNVDDSSYRNAEMKIKGRIRNLAANGAISLLEINELIFNKGQSEEDEELRNGESIAFSRGAFAA